MNRNKLLTQQIYDNGILSNSFPKSSNVQPKPEAPHDVFPIALAVLCMAAALTIEALLIIQFIYQ